MKIKLKEKGSKLSSFSTYQGLPYDKWNDLNRGKSVEVRSIPKLIVDQVKVIKPKGSK